MLGFTSIATGGSPMPSYRCELRGECGEKVKVAVWNDRFVLECERGGFRETERRKIMIPYVRQVAARCRECPLRDLSPGD